jgi:hypothetical protein
VAEKSLAEVSDDPSIIHGVRQKNLARDYREIPIAYRTERAKQEVSLARTPDMCITRVIKGCGGCCAPYAEVWVHQQDSGAIPAAAYMLPSVDSVQRKRHPCYQPDAHAMGTVTLRL